MPTPTSTNINNHLDFQFNNASNIEISEIFSFLQNESFGDFDELDLNSLPELKLQRQFGGYYGHCCDEFDE
jgi:hypothetical protein